MLESLLLGADIHHAWHGAVLIVGGRDEQQVDELVKSMEKATRPALDPDVEVVGYELAELSDDEVTRLTEALEDAEIPYGFDSDGDLEVAVSDEDRVDSLFDALASEAAQETFGPGLEGVEPHEVISKLFLASDRLARNPRDRRGLKDLNRFGDDIHQLSLPFGFDGKVWRALLQKVGALQEVVAEHHTAEEVASTAAETRAALHQFV